MNAGHAILPGNRRPIESLAGKAKGVSSDTFSWTDLQSVARQGSLQVRGNTSTGEHGPGWVAWSLLGRVVR